MNKIKVIVLFLFVVLLIDLLNVSCYAENYTQYEEIVFEHDDIKLMDEWSYYDKQNYSNRCKTKFFGWSTYYKYKKEKFDYVSETMYHVRNNGLENITHTFKYEEQEESNVQRNVSGNLEISTTFNKDNSKTDKFKFGLEGELEFEYKNTTKTKISETETIKIVVAPNTELFIRVLGKAYLTQGYAKKFFFFIPVKDGGFEYAVVTTEYYTIDMNIIDKDKV